MWLMNITLVREISNHTVIDYEQPESVSASLLWEASQMSVRAARSWVGQMRGWLRAGKRPAPWAGVVGANSSLFMLVEVQSSEDLGNSAMSEAVRTRRSNPTGRTLQQDLRKKDSLQLLVEDNLNKNWVFIILISNRYMTLIKLSQHSFWVESRYWEIVITFLSEGIRNSHTQRIIIEYLSVCCVPQIAPIHHAQTHRITFSTFSQLCSLSAAMTPSLPSLLGLQPGSHHDSLVTLPPHHQYQVLQSPLPNIGALSSPPP